MIRTHIRIAHIASIRTGSPVDSRQCDWGIISVLIWVIYLWSCILTCACIQMGIQQSKLYIFIQPLFLFRDKYTHFYICVEKGSKNVHYTLNKNILYYIIILLHISRYTYVRICMNVLQTCILNVFKKVISPLFCFVLVIHVHLYTYI